MVLLLLALEEGEIWAHWWLQHDLGDSLGLLGVREAAAHAHHVLTRYTLG